MVTQEAQFAFHLNLQKQVDEFRPPFRDVHCIFFHLHTWFKYHHPTTSDSVCKPFL